MVSASSVPLEDPVSDLLGDRAGELDMGEGCEAHPMDGQLSEARCRSKWTNQGVEERMGGQVPWLGQVEGQATSL